VTDRMCCYANCVTEKVEVRISLKGERLVYCCLDHAANGLASRYQRELLLRQATQVAAEAKADAARRPGAQTGRDVVHGVPEGGRPSPSPQEITQERQDG
jgi:hypothetical protein